MVQITSLFLATAAIIGRASAQHHVSPPTNACNTNEIYCGGELLAGQFFNYWKQRVDNALITAGQPTDGTHENDSTFLCVTGTAGSATLQYVDWCIDNGPNVRCHPPQRDACKRLSGGVEKNSCCDAN
ncbi:hypothetical protein B0T20DRAFT_395247 [Sordaria brevicollis]|uniref:Uncharacterized protein n=1 Tax=Sordaria brevicollis TaxID=83679 RepID=A0AAE0P8N6_SORBR|nr:hypothetical protein B0T20DRAFT_395247 [Sordaria brevicollis]